MENIVYVAKQLVTMIALIYATAFILGKISHQIRLSLIIIIYFAVKFFLMYKNSIDNEIKLDFASLIGFIICMIMIALGGKDVAFKTVVSVFSTIGNKLVGQMNAGAYNWSCPLTTKTSTDDHHNTAADLQALMIEIPETKRMQTSDRGIQAQILGIIIMLKLTPENLDWIYEIEGGQKTIQKRIIKFVSEFFLKEVRKKSPEFLDGKAEVEDPIAWIAENLKIEIEDFCIRNKYPYVINKVFKHHADLDGISEITIEDIKLDDKYYEELSKIPYALIDAKAKDIAAEKLAARINKTGNEILPNSSERERAEEAKITLGITPKTIQDQKFGINPETGELLKNVLEGILNKN